MDLNIIISTIPDRECKQSNISVTSKVDPGYIASIEHRQVELQEKNERISLSTPLTSTMLLFDDQAGNQTHVQNTCNTQESRNAGGAGLFTQIQEQFTTDGVPIKDYNALQVSAVSTSTDWRDFGQGIVKVPKLREETFTTAGAGTQLDIRDVNHDKRVRTVDRTYISSASNPTPIVSLKAQYKNEMTMVSRLNISALPQPDVCIRVSNLSKSPLPERQDVIRNCYHL
jgi:hypothetical protein